MHGADSDEDIRYKVEGYWLKAALLGVLATMANLPYLNSWMHEAHDSLAS